MVELITVTPTGVALRHSFTAKTMGLVVDAEIVRRLDVRLTLSSCISRLDERSYLLVPL